MTANLQPAENADCIAEQLARLLRERQKRLVLAESCTAGHAAATLAAIPGISEHFCGSVVAYRDRSKVELLGVDEADILRWSSVSETIAVQMARNVLARVTEANYSASITGHLGPGAPLALDGLTYIGTASRQGNEVILHKVELVRLSSGDRLSRREEATRQLLAALFECVRCDVPDAPSHS